jgi:hypothetical protein
MAIIQTKTKTVKKPLVGKPMGGGIGEFQNMIDKAKRGDRQAEADLKLERAKLKTFGEGPGAGASGGWPTPKKKMGGKVKKAENGGSLKTPAADQKGLKKLPTDVRKKMGFKKQGGTVKKAQMGTTMTAAPIMKKGGSMKKCKYGCK